MRLRLAEIESAARKQQSLTGKEDAVCAFVLPGKWPRGGKKRLFGKNGGPFGECLAEYEDAVLCAFKANEIIAYMERL